MKKFLNVASAVSFYSILMMLSPTSEASTVDYTFNGMINSGPLVYENFNGSFSFDDLLLDTNLDDQTLELTALSLNFHGATYDLSTQFDPIYQAAVANFAYGDFTGVSYVSDIIDDRPTASLVNDTFGPYLSYTPSLDGQLGSGLSTSISYNNITPSSVPVPAAIWLFGSGLAGFGVISRRKRQLAL